MVKLVSLVWVCCIRLCSYYSNFRELVGCRGRFQMVGVRGPLALIPEISRHYWQVYIALIQQLAGLTSVIFSKYTGCGKIFSVKEYMVVVEARRMFLVRHGRCRSLARRINLCTALVQQGEVRKESKRSLSAGVGLVRYGKTSRWFITLTTWNSGAQPLQEVPRRTAAGLQIGILCAFYLYIYIYIYIEKENDQDEAIDAEGQGSKK